MPVDRRGNSYFDYARDRPSCDKGDGYRKESMDQSPFCRSQGYMEHDDPRGEPETQQSELEQVVCIQSNQVSLTIRQFVLPLRIPPYANQSKRQRQANERFHSVQTLGEKSSLLKTVHRRESWNRRLMGNL